MPREHAFHPKTIGYTYRMVGRVGTCPRAWSRTRIITNPSFDVTRCYMYNMYTRIHSLSDCASSSRNLSIFIDSFTAYHDIRVQSSITLCIVRYSFTLQSTLSDSISPCSKFTFAFTQIVYYTLTIQYKRFSDAKSTSITFFYPYESMKVKK